MQQKGKRERNAIQEQGNLLRKAIKAQTVPKPPGEWSLEEEEQGILYGDLEGKTRSTLKGTRKERETQLELPGNIKQNKKTTI